MKNIRTILLLLVSALYCSTLSAQEISTDRAEMQKLILKQFHQRDASRKHLQGNIPLARVDRIASTAQNEGLILPPGSWFPGEWEEVKAIVVTCSYEHLVPGHENSYYWYADPLVTGYADYLCYNGEDWEVKGGGAYISVIDTISSLGEVFFYVMDAIQMGGAEAWVRIESGKDSSVVLRKLERMNLRHDNIRFLVGPGNSFWFRDCGPICFYYGEEDSVAMLDFMYYSGRALDDSLPSLIQQQMGIPDYITSIEWEGGNCLVDGAGMVISSDAICHFNSDEYGQLVWDGKDISTLAYEQKIPLSSQQVKDSLSHLLGSRATYILPALKFDGGTGHIDLYADMTDENSFVFSRYPSAYSRWSDYKTANKNIETLTAATSVFGNAFKRSFIPFPCDEDGNDFISQMDYNDFYTRTYSNHTFVNNVLIQPCFSAVQNGMPTEEWDRQRIEQLQKAYPGYTIYPINVSGFDGSGGAIHCITKQIPADNPIRILHASITGNTDETYADKDVEISATVTNRSGISQVKAYWRTDGGEWNESSLEAEGNDCFTGVLPLSSIDCEGRYVRVDYYLSASSNNGKTITKPMTASQGGYYTFYLGHNPNVGIAQAESEKFGNFFPNPANGKTQIRIQMGDNGRYSLRLIDSEGRECCCDRVESSGEILYTLPLEGLAKGGYHAVFQSDNGKTVVRHLIVQ